MCSDQVRYCVTAGPLSENTTPAYLNGEFPGDYGWVRLLQLLIK